MPSPPHSQEPDGVQHLEADLDAIRRRVLNVIGHELRTPTSTIHGLAVELADTDDLTVIREVLAPGILRGAERLTHLLDDLLIASGVTTAIPAGRSGDLDLAAVAARTWAQLSTRPLSIISHGWEVRAPAESVERAVRAILENAALYGSDLPEVLIGPTTQGEDDEDGADADDHESLMVAMTVVSPGPVLHEEESRFGVEPFFRGERAVTTAPGLGIGLSIARQVAEAAGGWLTFEGTDTGTRTVLALPGRRSQ